MKIKTDFVTNSSSTSFLIIVEDELTKEPFMELMGVDSSSKLSDMVSDLYYSMKDIISDIHEEYKSDFYSDSHSTFKEFVTKLFSLEVYEKVVLAEKDGKKVFIGSLRSEDEPFISFVCMDCFVEENEEIYFNYTNSTW